MKKIIRKVEDNIVQETIVDERWYIKNSDDGSQKFVPSVTWICGHYPKGIGFYKWLANKGWDEAEAIKQAAGGKGSKIHSAICDLLDNKEVLMNSKYVNPTTEQEEELTAEEYECLMSFVDWFNLVKPRAITRDLVVFNDEVGYAGTIDFICEIDDEVEGKVVVLIDFKTSQQIWPEHELQVSAYKHALPNSENVKLGILQLGYRKNKRKWKFTSIEDKFKLFLAAYRIWAEECSKIEPLKKDYPITLKLEGGEEDADSGSDGHSEATEAGEDTLGGEV